VKKKLPTKEEIKTARAMRKQGRALMVQANKVLAPRSYRRIPIRRKVSQAEANFRTWQHDYSILLPAVLRTPNQIGDWTPEDLAKHMAVVADRMQHEVASRRPGPATVHSRRDWLNWQNRFDEFVHAMSTDTNLAANVVISRAVELADAVMKVTLQRSPKKGKK
jgi:hypothetical protein